MASKSSIKHCYFLVICSAGLERFRGRVSNSLSSSAEKATLFTPLVHSSEADINIKWMFSSKASFRFSKGILHFNKSTSAIHNLLDNLCLVVLRCGRSWWKKVANSLSNHRSQQLKLWYPAVVCNKITALTFSAWFSVFVEEVQIEPTSEAQNCDTHYK